MSRLKNTDALSFGEAVSVFLGNKTTPSHIADHFKIFYLGFMPNSTIRFAYEDVNFSFEIVLRFDILSMIMTT
jgi:hypothetical protein